MENIFKTYIPVAVAQKDLFVVPQRYFQIAPRGQKDPVIFPRDVGELRNPANRMQTLQIECIVVNEKNQNLYFK